MTDYLTDEQMGVSKPVYLTEDQMAKPKPAEPWWDTGDVAKSVGANLLTGAASFSDAALTGGKPSDKTMEMEPVPSGTDLQSYMPRFKETSAWTPAGPPIPSPVMNALREAAPSVTDYQPTSTFGRYSGNVARMAPAAATMGVVGGAPLLTSLVGGAAVPGVSGELAKDVTENVARSDYVNGTNPERAGEVAKTVAELLSPFAASVALPAASTTLKTNMRTPLSEIDRLRAAGIDVTPGSYRVSQEAAMAGAKADLANPKMARIIEGQPQQFSNHVVNSFGITDDVARSHGFTEGLTPATAPKVVKAEIDKIGPSIGAVYDTVIARHFSPATWSKITQLASMLPDMPQFNPVFKSSGQWMHSVRQGANDILVKAAKNDKSGLAADAKMLIETIDDAVGQAVGPVNRRILDDVNAQYSRLKTLDAAFDNAFGRGHAGVIHPADLLEAGGTRHTANATDLAGTAQKYLVPQAEGRAVAAGGKRGLVRAGADVVSSLAAGLPSMLAYGMPMDIPSALATTGKLAAGLAASEGVQAALRAAKGSAYGQNVARSKALYGSPKLPLAGPAALTPPTDGLAEDRIGRKAGGRVGVDHDRLADRLVGAAERVKKGISRGTEQLLEMPDDHIAHALELANRSI